MTSRRLVEVSDSSWYKIGAKLAEQVVAKSSFAYDFDREAYSDEPDIETLWRKDIAPFAKNSMKRLTPLAFDLCEGFDSVLSGRKASNSTWELLTLYEIDMFLHEFHYKCRACKSRIMRGLRYICTHCPENPSKSSKKKDNELDGSVCEKCHAVNRECSQCGKEFSSTHILYETHGLGIANKSGCTGFGYAVPGDSVICGQTLEMATDTYNYGRFDTIYKLENTTSGVSVLVYDVGCILSPFGINSKGFGLCVFNLYNSDYSLSPYSSKSPRLPMAALQWEILLRGSTRIDETVAFLKQTASTFTSASFILASAKDRDTTVIEITANKNWVPEPNRAVASNEDEQPPALLYNSKSHSKAIVRANNCLAGSSLKSTESLPPNISSHKRQKNLFDSFKGVAETAVTLDWLKEALSTPTIQTYYCLGTILMEPKQLKLHVRFRVGTRISSTLKDGGKWETFSL